LKYRSAIGVFTDTASCNVQREIIFPARMAGIGASVAGVAGFWFLTTFTIGKGFCSWVCFFGGLDEGFSRVGGKKKRWNLDNLKILGIFHLLF